MIFFPFNQYLTKFPFVKACLNQSQHLSGRIIQFLSFCFIIKMIKPKAQMQRSDFQFPRKVYKNAINSWINYELNTQVNANAQFISVNYFQNTFLPTLHASFKNNITLDNLAADILNHLLVHETRFWKCLQHLPQLKMEKSPLQSFSWVATILRHQKFISKNRFDEIGRKSNDVCGTPTEKGIKNLEPYLSETLPISQKKQLWKKFMPIEISQFWAQIAENHFLLKQLPIIKNLFIFFSPLLKQQLNVQSWSTLQTIFAQKTKREQCLEKVANGLDFFQSNKHQKVKTQLEIIANRIEEQIFGGKNIKIEPYGSYRSHFCLLDSDVDLAIIFEEEDTSISEDRKFITKNLWKMYNYFKTWKQQHAISSISPIINEKIKVPFVMLKFQPTLNIESVDLVVNNQKGIINSRFLDQFSHNLTIRRLGLLVKQWGKKEGLISKLRLSSYGMLFMMLYYLMKTGNLSFVGKQVKQQKEFSFPVQLKKQKNLFKLFRGFFNFYCNNGPFFQTNEVICLIKGCEDHQNLQNSDFVINMHDTFDGSNPGRLKKRDENPFFNSIALMDQYLKSIKESSAEKLQFLFQPQEYQPKVVKRVRSREEDFDFI